MRTLFAIGFLIVILGVLALLVPIPRHHQEGIKAGKFSASVETTHDKKLPPAVGSVMLVAGGVMIVAGARKV